MKKIHLHLISRNCLFKVVVRFGCGFESRGRVRALISLGVFDIATGILKLLNYSVKDIRRNLSVSPRRYPTEMIFQRESWIRVNRVGDEVVMRKREGRSVLKIRLFAKRSRTWPHSAALMHSTADLHDNRLAPQKQLTLNNFFCYLSFAFADSLMLPQNT